MTVQSIEHGCDQICASMTVENLAVMLHISVYGAVFGQHVVVFIKQEGSAAMFPPVL